MMAKKPEKVVELAVKGMLPKGPLGREHVSRSFTYTLDRSTSMQAQKPEVLNILIEGLKGGNHNG